MVVAITLSATVVRALQDKTTATNARSGSTTGMIPGASKLGDIDVDDGAFKHIEAMIQSMTKEERARPELINGSRRRRIARGSGVDVSDVNQLLKQFRDMKKLMKTMTKLSSKGRSADMMKLLGGLR